MAKIAPKTLKIKIGDIFEHMDEADLTLVTTNGIISQNGSLVMGKGVAAGAKRLFPGIELLFGHHITNLGTNRYGFFFFIAPHLNKSRSIGAFQTKVHWRDFSQLDLINLSAAKLRKWMSKNPKKKVHLAFPGIGNGGLNEDEVLSVLRRHRFTDKLVLWKLK